jgi:hypothetical protein
MKLYPTATTALAAVVGATLMLAAPAGHAAEDSPTKMTPPDQQMQGQAASFSDEELKSFATAATEVQQLSIEWQKKLKEEKDQQKSQEMRQEATQEITQAVKDEGLTVEKYNQISMAARQDKDLRNKVVQYMNERK